LTDRFPAKKAETTSEDADADADARRIIGGIDGGFSAAAAAAAEAQPRGSRGRVRRENGSLEEGSRQEGSPAGVAAGEIPGSESYSYRKKLTVKME
jgi:hypothetical protein